MRTIRMITTGLASLALLAGATLGAAAQSPEAMAPAWVTGQVFYGTQRSVPTVTTEDGVTHKRAESYVDQRWDISDPRLSGMAVAAWNSDVYELPDGAGVNLVAVGTYEIVNDEGTWVGGYTSTGQGADDSLGMLETVTLTGSGAYEGLSAVLNLDWTTYPDSVEGMIIAGGLPPSP
jgi:hypothetical protein